MDLNGKVAIVTDAGCGTHEDLAFPGFTPCCASKGRTVHDDAQPVS